jgi:hypothetical protein
VVPRAADQGVPAIDVQLHRPHGDLETGADPFVAQSRSAQSSCLLRMRRMDVVISEYDHSISASLVDSGKDRFGYNLMLTMNSRRQKDRQSFLATVRSASR